MNMGCFNAICSVTGLPIYQNDKIKIAIIGESNKQDKYSRENDGSRFRFFVLPITGNYNEYGSIEFSELSENDKISLDINLALLKPGLAKTWGFKEYRNQEIEDLSSSQLFNLIVQQDLIYSPEQATEELPEYKIFQENKPIHGIFFRKDRYPNTSGTNYLNVWFCHEFAWNHIQSLTYPEFNFSNYENELIAALYSLDEIDTYFESKYNCKIRDFYSKDEILDEEVRKKALHEFSTLTGTCFSRLRTDIDFDLLYALRCLSEFDPKTFSLLKENRSLFKNKIIDALIFGINLRYINQELLPREFGGQCYSVEELNRHLMFNKLIQKHIEDKISDYEV